jgi:beta-lactamase superfamily II metal-dependent hydrolase
MAWTKVFIYDVDHGTCSSVIDSSGHVMLIDAGRSDCFSPIKHVAAELDVPIEDLTIDLFVLSHLHGEHVADIHNLLQADLRRTIFTPLDEYKEEELRHDNTDLGYYNLRLLETASSHFRIVQANPPNWAFSINTGFALSAEQARKIDRHSVINNSSRITIVEFAGCKIIFPGDLQRNGWPALLADPEFVTAASDPCVLVAPHHGHKHSFCPDVYMKLGKPFLNVISVDGQLSTGHYASDKTSRGWVLDGKTRKCVSTRTDGSLCIEIRENEWSIACNYLSANDY